ncbi:MAG TPA: hypothetical protein VM866_09925 [Pyrinomonadaceae bacterium]|nr:hypothetical protein [Pyrinomonadaceae bacterium]
MKQKNHGSSNSEIRHRLLLRHWLVTHHPAARWAQFFIDLHRKREVGSFINAFIHFPIGALVVAFHNVWEGIPLILTLMGYGWVLKGLIYFVAPSRGVKSMSRVSLERVGKFTAAGVVLVAIGGVLLFSLISKP